MITPDSETFSANLTDDFFETATGYLNSSVKNVILNLKHVHSADEAMAGRLCKLQQVFYENNASFVICEMQPAVEEVLEALELIDTMNITPTESEAWDIVQMEEIERELLDDDEPFFNDHGDEPKD